MQELNYKKMVNDINNIVSSEFCEEMSVRADFDREISQKQAKQMAHIIGEVYSIAHCITCKACSSKYHIIK
jgi:succinate dehydrogenase/fumarate reductase-like Fe-S protein